MSKEKVMALVCLASDNPESEGARTAASQACQMISKYGYSVGSGAPGSSEVGPGQPGWEQTRWGQWHVVQLDKVRSQARAQARKDLREEIKAEVEESMKLRDERRAREKAQRPRKAPETEPSFVYMRAKFANQCKGCNDPVVVGEPVYWKRDYGVLCVPCAEEKLPQARKRA